MSTLRLRETNGVSEGAMLKVMTARVDPLNF
jgi:hypothetical protein